MRRVATTLRSADRPLAQEFDVALLDLDGVVYVGAYAVARAADSLSTVRSMGMRLGFVTNNAARPPGVVADHLSRLGIPAKPNEVITSAQAAAHYLADRLPAGAAVLVVGTLGLEEALRERGLVPVHSADEAPQAVVQGYAPELNWHQLAEGAIAINRGLPWVATNLDPTVPSPRGPLPGNGSLVAALRHATGVTPISTGKPDPTMHRESVQRCGAERPIVVGDRLDTDVEGANAVGCPSLLVFTGVTSPAQLLTAQPQHRPSFVARDLHGLLTTHPAVRLVDGAATCGRWRASAAPGGVLTLGGTGEQADPTPDDLDPLRALCEAAWSARDAAAAGGWPSSTAETDPAPPECRSADVDAAAVLKDLGLA